MPSPLPKGFLLRHCLHLPITEAWRPLSCVPLDCHQSPWQEDHLGSSTKLSGETRNIQSFEMHIHRLQCHSNSSIKLLQLIPPPFLTATPNTVKGVGTHVDKCWNSNPWSTTQTMAHSLRISSYLLIVTLSLLTQGLLPAPRRGIKVACSLTLCFLVFRGLSLATSHTLEGHEAPLGNRNPMLMVFWGHLK